MEKRSVPGCVGSEGCWQRSGTLGRTLEYPPISSPPIPLLHFRCALVVAGDFNKSNSRTVHTMGMTMGHDPRRISREASMRERFRF